MHLLCRMFGPEYIKEYKINFKLAYPVVLGQVGHMITQIADAVMVGHIGTDSLAAASFASSVFSLVLVFVIGLATSITTLVGNAQGEQDEKGIYRLIGNGFWANTLFSVVLAAASLAAHPLLHHMGQDPNVVEIAIPYYQVLCWSTIPLMMFLGLKHAFDGMEWTLPGMSISLIANVLNVGLNFVFIYGHFGLPAMGLMGAGYATLISRSLMPLMALVILWFHPKLAFYKNALWKFRPNWPLISQIFKLGVPIGAQYLLEGGAFILGAIMVGWLGAAPLAAHQIAISIVTLTYMFASGLGSTATIRVSNLLGAKKYDRLRLVSRSLFAMIIGVEATFMLLILIFNSVLPQFFIHDSEVIHLAAKLLIIAAFFQLFDGIQVMSMGALRGFSDVKTPTVIALLTYWVISMPVGYILMTYVGLGASGIWYGLLIGLLLAAIFLTLRFVRLLRRATILAPPLL